MPDIMSDRNKAPNLIWCQTISVSGRLFQSLEWINPRTAFAIYKLHILPLLEYDFLCCFFNQDKIDNIVKLYNSALNAC